MRKSYLVKSLPFICVVVLIFTIASCKKDKAVIKTTTTTTPTPTKIGLYESDSSIFKLLFITVGKVGTQTLSSQYNYLVFDTGSGGMVIDAQGTLPASMITDNGFNFTGDSTVVDGITITNQTSTIEYGDDAATTAKVYGNLAYADVVVGDNGSTVTIKRLPFFIYYKSVDSKGNKLDPHEFDVFGVNSENDITFPNTVAITSPFSYFDPGTGLTKGFKMAALGTNNFSLNGTYVPGVVSLGLTADDLSSSSGFTMFQLTYYNGDGYPPIIPATIKYSGKTVSAEVLFDTGTDPYTYLEDNTAAKTTTVLPDNTTVALTTTSGYNYSYTTSATDNITNVENPSVSGVDISIFSLEFFLTNSYMLDYTDHKLGVKNN